MKRGKICKGRRGGGSLSCLGQHREGGSILLGSIGSTPGIELLSPIPALARREASPLGSYAALKDTAPHNAGSDRFSDLSQAKRRPALVVAQLTGADLILCQITSQAISDSYAVPVSNADFSNGGLNRNSNIRPNRLFTADQKIILYKAGQLRPEKLQQVIDKIIDIFQ